MARILDRVVGHVPKIQKLMQAIDQGRLAQTWIFAGPSGVGKKMTALGLGQVLVCERRIGCGQCGPCLRMEKMQSEDLLLIEPEGVQIKIEQARQVRQFVSLQGVGHARLVVIDEAQTMNPAAANALLKTLEEPPPDTYFILLVRSLASLLQTIRSRAQVVSFSGLSPEELKKIGDFDQWIIESSGGSVEQARLLSGEGWAETRAQAFAQLKIAIGDSPWKAFDGLKELLKDRETALFIGRSYQKWLRDVLAWRAGSTGLINADYRELIEAGANFSPEELEEICRYQDRIERDILGNVDRVLVFENFFLQLAGSTAG